MGSQSHLRHRRAQRKFASKMVSLKALVAAALVVVLAVAAAVSGFPDGYKKEQLGRVKIQVYRGPSKTKGYHSFAPWGYYFTQPEDYKKKGYH